MQRPPLTRDSAEQAENLHDDWQVRIADGEICANDLAYLTPRIHLLMVSTQRADLAMTTGLAVLRGGADTRRARGLLHEVETFMPLQPEAA